MKTNVNTDDITSVLRTNKKSSKWKKRLAFLIIIACLLIAAFFVMKPGEGKMQEFATAEVIQGDITVQVSATGTLEPTNEVDIGSELSGTIKEVFVDYNSRVKKGQVLARIDATKLNAQVFQYKAALKAAEANVMEANATNKETRLKLKQMKKLWILTKKRSPSQLEMYTAEAEYARAVAQTASANASVMQAKANLQSEQADLSKAAITSPVDGVVLEKDIEAGQTVAASYETPTLFTIAEDLKKMDLIVNVDEADIGQIAEGQRVTFTVDAHPRKIFKGIITQTRYGSTTTDNVVTYETVIKVDNSDLLLRPGMTATADIIVKEIKGAIKIPKVALRYSPPVMQKSNRPLIARLMPGPPHRNDKNRKKPGAKQGGGITVWKQGNNGMPEPIDLELGVADGAYKQMVKGEIQPGDRLITGQANGK